MKFTISAILALTFWCGATIAGISLLHSSTEKSQLVIPLLASAFMLATLGFSLFALFSTIYGAKSARPFWLGCTVVCGLLIFVDPFINFGFTPICALITNIIKQTPNAGLRDPYALDINAWFSFSEVQRIRSGITTVLRSAAIPLLGIIGGILAQSISQETKRQNESDDRRLQPVDFDDRRLQPVDFDD